mgnify:FL=1
MQLRALRGRSALQRVPPGTRGTVELMERLPFKLRRARLQLMLKHPYLASAVARFPICIRTRQEGVSTMATDGYRIYANTEFVERISSDQLLGVLAHELMHNLLGHLEREQGRDSGRWNVAIDHAVNLMLEEMNFTLPDPKCCDRRFYGLTAEEIYKQLPDGRDAENWDLHLSADLKNRTGAAGSNSLSSQQKNRDSDDSASGVEDTGDQPTPLELQRIREGLRREMIREVESLARAGKLPGNLPGFLKQEFQMAGAAQIP